MAEKTKRTRKNVPQAIQDLADKHDIDVFAWQDYEDRVVIRDWNDKMHEFPKEDPREIQKKQRALDAKKAEAKVKADAEATAHQLEAAKKAKAK